MADLVAQLHAALPDLRILSDAADVEGFRFDETAFLHAGRPSAVCFPRSTADVVAIVGVAAQGIITCGQPFTMKATVLDADGAPVADASVAWSFVTTQSSSDTIHKTPTITNSKGVATTTVTLGAVSGDRRIRATTTVGETGATSEVSASGVVNQSCGGLPRTDTLASAIPQAPGDLPLAAGLLLVLAFAVGGWLTLRRLAVTNR